MGGANPHPLVASPLLGISLRQAEQPRADRTPVLTAAACREDTMGKRGERGSGLDHPVMVRLDADSLDRLDWLCARWGRARGTLARQLIVDGLGELLNTASPIWAEWTHYRQGRRVPLAGSALKPTLKQSRIAGAATPANVTAIRPRKGQ